MTAKTLLVMTTIMNTTPPNTPPTIAPTLVKAESLLALPKLVLLKPEPLKLGKLLNGLSGFEFGTPAGGRRGSPGERLRGALAARALKAARERVSVGLMTPTKPCWQWRPWEQ